MRKIALLAALALLAGCETPQATNSYEPKRVQVEELESRHAVLFTPGSEQVMEAEREALGNFLYPLLRDGAEEVLVEAPGPNADHMARNRSLAVVGLLAERQITTRMVPLTEYTPGQVRVIVRRQTAYVPDCPDWSSDEASPWLNGAHSNFGCATALNLSIMIDNPADLVRGRSSTVNTGDSAGDAANRVRNRQTVPLGSVASE